MSKFTVVDLKVAKEYAEQEASMSLLPQLNKGEFKSLQANLLVRDGIISGIQTNLQE